MSDQSLPDIPLPSGWTKCAKTAMLHVISLAQYAMATARGRAANSINARVRFAADKDQLKKEVQLLREELHCRGPRRSAYRLVRRA